MTFLEKQQLNIQITHNLVAKMCGGSVGNCLFQGRTGMLLVLFELAKRTNNDYLNTYAFRWLEHLYLACSSHAQKKMAYIDLVSIGWLLAEGQARDYFEIEAGEEYKLMGPMLVKAGRNRLSFEELCITLMYVSTRLQLTEMPSIVNSLVLKLWRYKVPAYSSLQVSILSALYRRVKECLFEKNSSMFHSLMTKDHSPETSLEEPESRAVASLLFHPDVILQKMVTGRSPEHANYQALQELLQHRTEKGLLGLDRGVAGLASLISFE